jgi:hypothetical protein
MALSTLAMLRTFGVDTERLTTEGIVPFDGLLFRCMVGEDGKGPFAWSLLNCPSSSPSGEGRTSEM